LHLGGSISGVCSQSNATGEPSTWAGLSGTADSHSARIFQSTAFSASEHHVQNNKVHNGCSEESVELGSGRQEMNDCRLTCQFLSGGAESEDDLEDDDVNDDPVPRTKVSELEYSSIQQAALKERKMVPFRSL
jgi:hypothetical protein